MSRIKQWYQKQSATGQALSRGVALIAIGTLAMMVYSAFSGLLAGIITFPTPSLVINVIIAGVALLIFAKSLMVIVAYYSDQTAKLGTRIFTHWRPWLVAIGLFAALRLFQSLLIIILPHAQRTQTTVNQGTLNHIFQGSTAGAIYIVLLAILLAPMAEEIIFRWLPFRVLHNPWLAMLIGGLAFTVSHVPNNLTAWLLYGSMALVLETMYYFWGLKGSLVLHVMINATATLAMIATL